MTVDKDTPGVKFDGGKIRYDLIPVEALREVAKVYTMGAVKYADNNWRKGIAWGRIYAAVQRHLSAYWGGEDTDSESGLSHLAHAAWGMLTLLEYADTHKEQDDRYVTKTRDNVLPEHTQAVTQDPVPSKDAQSLRGRAPRRVVLRDQGGLVGGVQMDSLAQALADEGEAWAVGPPKEVA